MEISLEKLKRVVEAALLMSREPQPAQQLAELFTEEEEVTSAAIVDVCKILAQEYQNRGVELVEVASGYRFQVCSDLAPWISRTMAEKPQRYSRAVLETLALVAYRQPITRAEIEDIRGVAVSTQIMRTLEEREWVRVIGHRDVPGRPGLYATTKQFLDDFNLKSLGELPTLAELRDLDQIEASMQQQNLGIPEPAQSEQEVTESSQQEHENIESTQQESELPESSKSDDEKEDTELSAESHELTDHSDSDDEDEDTELSAESHELTEHSDGDHEEENTESSELEYSDSDDEEEDTQLNAESIELTEYSAHDEDDEDEEDSIKVTAEVCETSEGDEEHHE